MNFNGFIPTGDRVLVRRLHIPDDGLVLTSAHDERAGTEMIQASGMVLAVGPGKFDDDGDFCPTTVKPGQFITFNARWNDFAHDELKGSDCDGKGPLERPLPQMMWHTELYLITEGDIAGIF